MTSLPHSSDEPRDERTPARAAAFGGLVAAHTERLVRYAYRLVGSREVAEDIVQDLFVRMWERGEDRTVRDVLPYLYHAARNRALSHLRHSRVRARWRAMLASAPPPAAPPSSQEVEETDLARAIRQAVQDLPERCREVFTMSREQGLTHREIARVLGLSVKTVESHVWRAMTTLRARLAPYLEQ
jgi:RNA polymerase sigma-70 factor, ECF subfamily